MSDTTERLEPLPPAAPAKRRGPRRGILIAIVVVLVLVVVGYFVAERLVRNYAENYVREQVVAALGLPNGDGVGVELGAGSFLLQAAGGSINNLRVTIDRLDVGDLSGAAVLTGTGVPLDSASPVEKLAVTLSLDEDQLSVLSDSLSGSNLDGVALEDGVIRITANLSVGPLNLPVTVGLLPGVEDGDIAFTPRDITAAGQTLTADALRDGLFGSVAGPLLQTRSFCIADQLPAALLLDSVQVDGRMLVIGFTGDGVVLGSPNVADPGSCA